MTASLAQKLSMATSISFPLTSVYLILQFSAQFLLHLRDPFRALQEAAARTKRIVVTEPLQDPSLEIEENVMRFASANFTNASIWWTFTPGSIRQMLSHLGFNIVKTTISEFPHHVAHDMKQDPVQMRMFTVVGEKPV